MISLFLFCCEKTEGLNFIIIMILGPFFIGD